LLLNDGIVNARAGQFVNLVMAINVIVNLAIVIASEDIFVSLLGVRIKPNIRDRVVVGGLLVHGFRV
jgi:hypothetical protein